MKTFGIAFRTATISVFFSLLFVKFSNGQDFKIRGRLHLDAFYCISEASEFSNGFNNRRARMGMEGKITDNWEGRIEVDFANGEITPLYFMMHRSFEHGGRLWIGQFKVPQGLNLLTSSNAITFIERSSPVTSIVPALRMGLAYEHFARNRGFQIMLFGRAIGQINSIEDDMPAGAVLRGVYAPEFAGGILHMGGSLSYENMMDNNSVQFSDRPEARDSKGGSVKFIDVTVTDVRSTLKTGAEILYINGPFSVECEYLSASVNRNSGVSPLFSGWHVQAGYVMTGESRTYSKGVPGTVSPLDGKGAWEMAIRYSQADLNDAGFTGGVQKNITIGLNRYVASNLRFMGNLVFVNVEETDEKPVLGVIRAQFSF